MLVTIDIIRAGPLDSSFAKSMPPKGTRVRLVLIKLVVQFTSPEVFALLSDSFLGSWRIRSPEVGLVCVIN